MYVYVFFNCGLLLPYTYTKEMDKRKQEKIHSKNDLAYFHDKKKIGK